MSSNALKQPDPSKPQILICDDDIAFSSELIDALQMRGFPATALLTMSSIRAAILGPSILLLDICMPEPDGFEILKMLATHGRRDHFKIVMMSGSDERMLISAGMLCQDSGLYLLGTFRKPIKVRELCELLETAGLVQQ